MVMNQNVSKTFTKNAMKLYFETDTNKDFLKECYVVYCTDRNR